MVSARLDMPRRKRTNPERNRVEFVAEPEWIDRVVLAGNQLGLSISAYIRLVVTQRMNADNVPEPEPRRQKGGRKG